MSPSEPCWSTTSSLMQLKIMSLCRSSLRTKVGKQNSAAAWNVLLDVREKREVLEMPWTGHSCQQEHPWLLRGGFCQHSPLPTGRASSWAARLSFCVPWSHRVTTGSWVGVMFCLPGTRPSDPTHHQPSPRESARASARLSMAWAWPPPPALLPFLQETALAEQGDGPACSCSCSLSSPSFPAAVPLPTNTALALFCRAGVPPWCQRVLWHEQPRELRLHPEEESRAGWLRLHLRCPPGFWGICRNFLLKMCNWSNGQPWCKGYICLEDTPRANSVCEKRVSFMPVLYRRRSSEPIFIELKQVLSAWTSWKLFALVLHQKMTRFGSCFQRTLKWMNCNCLSMNIMNGTNRHYFVLDWGLRVTTGCFPLDLVKPWTRTWCLLCTLPCDGWTFSQCAIPLQELNSEPF